MLHCFILPSDRILHTAEEVRKTLDGISCASEPANVTYAFEDEQIVRTQGSRIDTFRVAVEEFKMSFTTRRATASRTTD